MFASLQTQNRVVQSKKLGIGVCYGLNGRSLPSPIEVVSKYKKHSVGKMRIYEPNRDVLNALRGSDIDLTLGVRNQDIPFLATNFASADWWFQSNVEPYLKDINIPYITVGNEVVPGQFSESLVPAMQNLQTVLRARNLMDIVTTTVVHAAVLSDSYPPSAAHFSTSSNETMNMVARFLSSQGAPLLINIYPYLAFASDPWNIDLNYALFNTNGTAIQDGNLSYRNLFDAMVDSYIWAMEKIGVTNVDVVISESGWPHSGNGDLTTQELAATYNRNFIQHVTNGGTPKRPYSYVEGFLFSMFDEDQKPDGVEQNWGLFKTDMQPNYDLLP
ncbi:putative glucan endo-1,3-beta-glucosidase BG5 [Drosera capensis]